MRVRLNGWQRIGIVLSVIWAIGGFFWGNSILIDSASWRYKLSAINSETNDTNLNTCLAEANTTRKWCDASANRALTLCGHPTSDPDCSIANNSYDLCGKKETDARQTCWNKWQAADRADLNEASETFIREMDNHWYFAVIFALAPIPFAWLIVYALNGLWRWTRRGFST
jgi:hypothetical protein